LRVKGSVPDWPPAAGWAGLVTPAMKRSASLIALYMERQGVRGKS
jgi:hypothetical protein